MCVSKIVQQCLNMKTVTKDIEVFTKFLNMLELDNSLDNQVDNPLEFQLENPLDNMGSMTIGSVGMDDSSNRSNSNSNISRSNMNMSSGNINMGTITIGNIGTGGGMDNVRIECGVGIRSSGSMSRGKRGVSASLLKARAVDKDTEFKKQMKIMNSEMKLIFLT